MPIGFHERRRQEHRIRAVPLRLAKLPGQLPMASRIGCAQTLFDNIQRTMDTYGTTPGLHIALDDIPPPIFFSNTMKAVMQEIVIGTRDVDKLLKMLDDDWDSALKGM